MRDVRSRSGPFRFVMRFSLAKRGIQQAGSDPAELCDAGRVRSAACPSDEALARFSTGSVDGASAAEMEAHLADCRDCRAVVGAIVHAPTMDGATISLGSGDDELPRRRVRTGDTIARYVVLNRVGAGAMGAVYKAYDPVLERAIALKLLHDGGTAEKRDRMLREAQALARVAHANVIAVHDVGILDNDVYLAMELVVGTPFHEWLRAATRPSTEAILSAFIQAGQGLAAAHAAGLIHRDFKPSNALIGADGRVRVVDFGLARGQGVVPQEDSGVDVAESLDAPTSSRASPPSGSSSGLVDAALTAPGVLAGTPRYMAPEQRRLEPLTAAADQFAFSVALWESLSETHPFANARGALRSSPPRGAPRERRPIASHVRRALLRGLSWDPAARYPSMAALLDDLRHDPRARARRTLAYSAAALAVIAAASAFAVRAGPSDVCAGGGARFVGIWDDAVDKAVAESLERTGWAGARDEATRLRSSMNAYVRRWTETNHDACVAARVDKTQTERVFDLRSQCLERRLVEARTATQLLRDANRELAVHATTLIGALGDPGACSASNVNVNGEALPKDEAVRAHIASVRGQIDRASVLRAAGKIREARAALTQASVDAREIAYEPLVAEALLRRAEVEAKDGDGAAGMVSLDEASLRASRAGEDRLVAEALLTRSELLTGSINRPASSLDLVPVIAAAVARAGSPPDLESRRETNVARTLDELGRCAEALGHAREGFRISELAFGKDSTQAAVALGRLSAIERLASTRDDARRDSADAVARLERVLGRDHPELFDALLAQASAENSGGDLHVAESILRRAIALLDSALPNHPRLAEGYRRLGSTLALLGRDAEAEAALEKAATLALEDTPPDLVVLGDIYSWLGDVVRELRGIDAARPIYAKVRDAFKASGRTMDPFYGETLSLWASAECDAGNLVDAEARFAEARVVLGQREDFWRVKLMTTEADCLVASKRPERAIAIARGAVARFASLDRKDDLADARYVLARALWDTGDKKGGRAEAHLAIDALAGTGRARAADFEAWLAKH